VILALRVDTHARRDAEVASRLWVDLFVVHIAAVLEADVELWDDLHIPDAHVVARLGQRHRRDGQCEQRNRPGW